MKPTGYKKLLFLIAGAAILSSLIFFVWKGYQRFISDSTVIENELENELRGKKEKQIAEDREMFSDSTKPDDVIDWGALTRTDTTVQELKEPVELNSATITMQKKSEQKSTVTESERPPTKNSSDKAKTEKGVSYSVQIAALSNVKAAEGMTEQLLGEGFAAHIERVELEDGKVLFRVRIGKFETRTDAEKELKKLIESGRKGFVAKQ